MHCLLARWPWRRKRQPSPVLLPGKSHRQRLAGCSPWGRRKLDMTEESTTLRNHLAASSSPSVKGHSTRWAAAKTRPREGHAGSPQGGCRVLTGKGPGLSSANVRQPQLKGEKRQAHGASHRQTVHARGTHRTEQAQVNKRRPGSQPVNRQKATRQRRWALPWMAGSRQRK